MNAHIESALFRQPGAVTELALRLIERDTGDTDPVQVDVRWLGIGTALVAWHLRGDDGTMFAKTATYTGRDADELHDAEDTGSTSFPPLCRAEHDDEDGLTVVCRLRSPHYPFHHSDTEGTTWGWSGA